MKKIKSLAEKYKIFARRDVVISVAISIGLLFLSLVINFYAGIYATERVSNPVNDIVLSNVPVFDVDYIFLYGPIVLWIFVGLLCIWEPKRIAFTLKSIALFVLIRSVFITLTHIGPFPDRIPLDYSLRVVRDFSFGGDLFFSAHTGLPFLMALVFNHDRFLRALFIVAAFFFGIIVLLGHLHYSIDVLSAFFITYTIYSLAKVFFAKDHELFLAES